VNQLLSGLTTEELTLYSMERKDPFIAWIACAVLGSFGAHHFYLGNTRTGMFRLLFSFTGIPTILAAFELFTIHEQTKQLNNQLLLMIHQAAQIAFAPVFDARISHEFVGPYEFETTQDAATSKALLKRLNP